RTAGILSLPRWSPNGSQLIYNGPAPEELEHSGRYLVPRLGGPSRRLGPAVYAAWSPDGTRLAIAGKATKGFAVVTVGGDIVGKVALADFRWIDDLDWQRTSDRLAIIEHNDQGQFVLSSITTEGKDRRRIYVDANGLSSPQWAPAGDTIYCLRAHNEA